MIDRTGVRYGRLVVQGRAGKQGTKLLWKCRCDCGGGIVVTGNSLTTGNTKSCGCASRDAVIGRNKAMAKHGLTNSPEFYVWQGAKRRCYGAKSPNYPRYGGRGIKMCDRWRDSFINFYADMGPRPSPRHQLDRINNDGDYEPGNCRWAMPHTQAINRSTTIRLTINGETKPVGDWSRECGISALLIMNRIRSGWTANRAITEPVRRRHG